MLHILSSLCKRRPYEILDNDINQFSHYSVSLLVRQWSQHSAECQVTFDQLSSGNSILVDLNQVSDRNLLIFRFICCNIAQTIYMNVLKLLLFPQFWKLNIFRLVIVGTLRYLSICQKEVFLWYNFVLV